MALLKNFCKNNFLKVLFSIICLFISVSTQARPKYKQATIKIASQRIQIEVAKTDDEHEFGLMYVNKMKPEKGMLFIFKDEQVRNFWMKNTLIPLSIGFFNKNMELVSTKEMVPYVEGSGAPEIYSSEKPAMYALEMNKNWFSVKKIKIGDKFQYVQ